MIDQYSLIQLEFFCIRKNAPEENFDRDNEKYTFKEYHDNGNIKIRKVKEIKRDTKF